MARDEFHGRTRTPVRSRRELARGTLTAFDARLRPHTGLLWPVGAPLGPDEAIELARGPVDLLVLAHRGGAHRPDGAPRHETLMIELGRALADCKPGLVPVRRLVYRRGDERLTYQATRVLGNLTLVTVTPDAYVLAATLELVAPELDLDGLGPQLLAGTIRVPRT